MGYGFSRKRLRGHRDGLGLTRAEVGARIGRKPSAVQAWEEGGAEPPARMLAALADLFDISVDDLWTRYDDPVEDYIDAVASHCRPLTDEELEGAAVVLRRINHRLTDGLCRAGDTR